MATSTHRPFGTKGRTATDRQVDTLKRMSADLVTLATQAKAFALPGAEDFLETAQKTEASLKGYFDRGDLSFTNASKAIDFIAATNKKLRSLVTEAKHEKLPKAPDAGSHDVTEDGMYRTADGTIFKVQKAVHGSGHLYAKKLVVNNEAVRADDGSIVEAADVSFTYSPGAIKKLRPSDKMSLEQAKAFGALYGTCCVCGRTLTKEESIEAGIGPVCAGKF